MANRQFLDNTGNDDRSLRPYLTQDVSGQLYPSCIVDERNDDHRKDKQPVQCSVYEPNGYTHSYISGGQTQTENYYFPMAGTNLLVGVSVRF